jgi:CheY-like chemotaxis protein
LYFEIRDTGIGMNQTQLARLFEAFTQADNSTTRKHGGTGLGLHISQRLASMLGGEITVRSEPDRGSTFRLTIRAERWAGTPDLYPGPIKPVPSAEVAVSSPISDVRPLAGRRILLAEDGPDNTRLITFHLRRAGAEVVAVENGRLAMDQLTRDRTAGGELDPGSGIDLVITDIQMPEMDGYELAGQLRQRGWVRPIIALTAHAMAGDRERCLAAGCDAYCTKPVQAAELVEVCRAALAAEDRGQRPGFAA